MTAASLSPEELADRIEPEDPRISPDGSLVAFTAAPLGKTGEHAERAVWIGQAGRPARKFSAGTSDDRAPRWAPDGRTLAFLSDRHDRGKQSGLYLLSMDGGEAQRLGEMSGALSGPEWSPDGTRIAVLRTDEQDAARKKAEEDRDDRVLVEAEPRFTRLWVVDAATGKARCLTTGDREVRAFCWAPDGESLVAVTTALPGWDEVFSPADAWSVPAHGGLPRRLASFPIMPRTPAVVGDTVLIPAEGGRDDPPTSVWAFPLAGGEPRNLTPGWDVEVGKIVALPGKPGTALVHAVRRVNGSLFFLDVATGETTPAGPQALRGRGSIMSASATDDAARFAAIWTDSATPEEVWLGSERKAAPVTEFGKAFAGRLQPGEVVRWTSTDGVEVEGILIRPKGAEPGTPVPLVVEIHGGPSWQWEDRAMLNWHDWAQMLADMGIAVLLPNPRGSTAYGAKFQALLQDDVGGGEADDLISGAQAMVERGIADPARLGVGGWSWGGYLTARTVTRTTMFAAAVMGAGLSNMISDHGTGDIPQANLLYYPGHPYEHMDHYWRSSPIRDVTKVTTPTLILHGDADARVHPAQGAEFFRALKVLGVPVEFVRYPREGHPIEERLHQVDLMRRVAAWYRRWLLEPAG